MSEYLFSVFFEFAATLYVVARVFVLKVEREDKSIIGLGRIDDHIVFAIVADLTPTIVPCVYDFTVLIAAVVVS